MERAHRGLRARLHRPGGELRRREALGGPTSHYVRAFCDARTVYGGRIAHCFPLTGPIGRVISGRGRGYLVPEVGRLTCDFVLDLRCSYVAATVLAVVGPLDPQSEIACIPLCPNDSQGQLISENVS